MVRGVNVRTDEVGSSFFPKRLELLTVTLVALRGDRSWTDRSTEVPWDQSEGYLGVFAVSSLRIL